MGRPKLIARARLRFAAVLVAVCATGSARAQSAEDKAAADAAFDQGKRLMAARSYAEACQKFSESLRRDPGIGTMLGLADCFEKNGQTASAWAQFREAAATAASKSDGREKVARENVERLTPLLSKLAVHVPVAADVNGLTVKRDGVEVNRAIWDTEIPVDPGVHTVTAVAPGKKEWQASITIAAAARTETVTIPKLEPAPEPPIAAAPAVISPGASSIAPEAPPSDPNAGRTQRYIGLGVGAAGVVGIAVGSIFGLGAKSKLDDSNADNHCDASDACDATGKGLRDDAQSAATVSTIAFIAGAAAVAGGVVLYLTAPKPHGARVGVAPSPGGVTVIGAF
jgi:hypothetical protein